MTNQHFTSFERDPASVNDNASHRFYVNRLGRFSAVDPVLGGGASPQRFNLYSYTGNDPVNRWDPSGRDYICFPSFVIEDWDPFDLIGYDPDPFWFPCEDGSGGGEGGGGSCNPDSLEGNSCPPPVPVPPPPPPTPRCFCQLKYRHVQVSSNHFGINHDFWYMQDLDGQQRIITSGPTQEGGGGYLNDLILTGAGIYTSNDNPSQTTWFNSGLSAANCLGAEIMYWKAEAYPNNTYRYVNFPGPNSNSFAHYIAEGTGFDVSSPPGSWGWGWPIGL